MEKIILLATAIFCVISSTLQATTCRGSIVSSTDGTRWCISNLTINWPSAQTWCKAQNLSPISLSNCSLVNGVCTNAINITGHNGYYIWLQEAPNKTAGYIIYATGSIGQQTRTANQYMRAACRMPDE